MVEKTQTSLQDNLEAGVKSTPADPEVKGKAQDTQQAQRQGVNENVSFGMIIRNFTPS